MKKSLSLILSLILLLSLVSLPALAEEEIKLQVWYAVSGTSGETFTELANRWDAANDGVSLELSYSGNSGDTATKVSAALLSGTEPDVALMYAGPLYTGARGDLRMDEWYQAGDFDAEDVYEGMWEYCKFAGKVGAVPFGISTQVLYYNKDIMEAAGIDMSTPPATWEELYEVAKQAVEKGNINNAPDFAGFEVSDPVWLIKSMFMQNGNPVVEVLDGEVVPVFNNEKAVEVANFWKKMVDDKLMPAGEHNNAEKKFLAGNSAFIAASSNRISRWTTTEFGLGAIEMPTFGEKSVALGGNVLVVLTQDERRAAAAKELVAYLASAENQAEFALKTGYLPTHKSALEMDSIKEAISQNPMYNVAFSQLAYAWAYTHFDEMGTMDMLLWTAVNQIEKGAKTPQAALDYAVEELIMEMED